MEEEEEERRVGTQRCPLTCGQCSRLVHPHWSGEGGGGGTEGGTINPLSRRITGSYQPQPEHVTMAIFRHWILIPVFLSSCGAERVPHKHTRTHSHTHTRTHTVRNATRTSANANCLKANQRQWHCVPTHTHTEGNMCHSNQQSTLK